MKIELASVRTGRAHASLVEDLEVEAYGQKMKLRELAGISAPDPHLLLIEPWDKSIIKDIEKSLRLSSLGLNPAVAENTIRLPVPSLTEERRKSLVKVAAQAAEEARQKIRRSREEAISRVKELEKNKKISEDDKFRSLKEIQKQIDEVNLEIEKLGKMKEEEILRI